MLRRRIPPRLRTALLAVRAYVGRFIWVLHLLDPVTRRVRQMTDDVKPDSDMNVVLVSIYRPTNVPLVSKMVEEAHHAGWTIRLWALDDVSESLQSWTIGSGPGERSRLLNELLQAAFDWVIIVDDDVEVVRGSLTLFLALAQRMSLDMAQPAHTPGSVYTFDITRVHPLRYVRKTTFVEIGPVLAISRRAGDRVLPLPEESGMGWGLDAKWALLAAEGRLRLGVVDAVTIHHHGVVGADYGRDRELRRLDEQLARLGVRDMRDLQRTIGSVFFWHDTDARLRYGKSRDGSPAPGQPPQQPSDRSDPVP